MKHGPRRYRHHASPPDFHHLFIRLLCLHKFPYYTVVVLVPVVAGFSSKYGAGQERARENSEAPQNVSKHQAGAKDNRLVAVSKRQHSFRLVSTGSKQLPRRYRAVLTPSDPPFYRSGQNPHNLGKAPESSYIFL